MAKLGGVRIPDMIEVRAACPRKDACGMPEISRFFGIIVQMYYSDHEPPHFHVRYSGQKALIAIGRQCIARS